MHDGVEHRFGEAPRLGVVAAAVIAVEETHAVGQVVDRVVREPARARLQPERHENRIVRDAAERQNRSRRSLSQLFGEVAVARARLGRGRLVLRREAFHRIRDAAPGELQPVAGVGAARVIRESVRVKRAIKEDPGIVTRERTPCPVRAVHPRGETDDEQRGGRIAERRHRASVVGRVRDAHGVEVAGEPGAVATAGVEYCGRSFGAQGGSCKIRGFASIDQDGPMAKVNATEIRAGNLLEHEKRVWRVLKSYHVHVGGRGGAYMQVEMKDIETGTKTNVRFRTEEKIERAFVEAREMEYLYNDGTGYVFMDKETFEQLTLAEDFLEGQSGYLLPNTPARVLFHNERPIGVELPASVELTVVDTEPGIKNATVTTSFKPATMETGLVVQVPPFVNAGEKIKVNTNDGSYMERA